MQFHLKDIAAIGIREKGIKSLCEGIYNHIVPRVKELGSIWVGIAGSSAVDL
jgi:hypothetical protein